YRDALRLDPSLTQARINLAKALLDLGRADEALAELGQAAGGAADTDQPEIHAARAMAFAIRGDATGAAAETEAALRHVPDFASVHARLGIVLVQAGRLPEAESQLRRAIALGLKDAEVYAGLGDALQREGRTAEAAEQLRAAVRLRPGWVEPSNNLAWILATAPDPGLRRPEEAITLAEAAARGTNRKNANVLDTLAVAYEAAGRRADALAVAREALALARAQRENELSETLAKRVRSYEADLTANKQ
ncbi:MAG TPA: hypothetical protein DEP35_17205, partial [Deltaproteobacteria bacterium]|nr:hypothetical protein [Deltaproteobacteria bacterium]